LSKTYVA